MKVVRWLRYWYCRLFNVCEHKNFSFPCTGKVELESGRTAYHTLLPREHWDNPNRCVRLCRDHAQEHHEHWDDMWSNVPRG